MHEIGDELVVEAAEELPEKTLLCFDYSPLHNIVEPDHDVVRGLTSGGLV